MIVIADRDELGNETVSADFDALCCGEGAVVAKDGTVSDKETASALGDKTLVENAVRTETDRRPTCDADPNTTADITTATEADAGVKTTVDGEAPSSPNSTRDPVHHAEVPSLVMRAQGAPARA